MLCEIAKLLCEGITANVLTDSARDFSGLICVRRLRMGNTVLIKPFDVTLFWFYVQVYQMLCGISEYNRKKQLTLSVVESLSFHLAFTWQLQDFA